IRPVGARTRKKQADAWRFYRRPSWMRWILKLRMSWESFTLPRLTSSLVLVSELLCQSRLSTIARLVVAVIVDAITAYSARALAHVRQEIRKFAPALAYSDAAFTVPLVIWIFRIFAVLVQQIYSGVTNPLFPFSCLVLRSRNASRLRQPHDLVCPLRRESVITTVLLPQSHRQSQCVRLLS